MGPKIFYTASVGTLELWIKVPFENIVVNRYIYVA